MPRLRDMVRLRKFVRGGPLSPAMSRVLQQEVANACSDVVQELAEEFVPDTLCEAYRGLLDKDLRPSFDRSVLKQTKGRFPYGLRGGEGAALSMEMGGVAQSLQELGRKTVARTQSQIAQDLRGIENQSDEENLFQRVYEARPEHFDAMYEAAQDMDAGSFLEHGLSALRDTILALRDQHTFLDFAVGPAAAANLVPVEEATKKGLTVLKYAFNAVASFLFNSGPILGGGNGAPSSPGARASLSRIHAVAARLRRRAAEIARADGLRGGGLSSAWEWVKKKAGHALSTSIAQSVMAAGKRVSAWLVANPLAVIAGVFFSVAGVAMYGAVHGGGDGDRGGFCQDRVAAGLEAAGLPTVAKSRAAGAKPYSEEVVRAFLEETFRIGEGGELVFTERGADSGVAVRSLRADGTNVVFEAAEGERRTVRMAVRADAEKVARLFAEAQIERWKRTAMGFVYTKLSPLWICTLDNLILAPVDALKDMVEKNLGWIPGGAVVLMASLAVQKLGDYIYRQGAANDDLQYKVAGIVIGLFCDLKNGGSGGAHRSILQVAPMVCLQPLLRFAQVYDLLMLTLDSFRHETPPATTIQIPRSLAITAGDTDAIRAVVAALNGTKSDISIRFAQEANKVDNGEVYLRIVGKDGKYAAKSSPTFPLEKVHVRPLEFINSEGGIRMTEEGGAAVDVGGTDDLLRLLTASRENIFRGGGVAGRAQVRRANGRGPAAQLPLRHGGADARSITESELRRTGGGGRGWGKVLHTRTKKKLMIITLR